MGNATVASMGTEAARAMEATLAPDVTKVNILITAKELLELNCDMGLNACVPKAAGGGGAMNSLGM